MVFFSYHRFAVDNLKLSIPIEFFQMFEIRIVRLFRQTVLFSAEKINFLTTFMQVVVVFKIILQPILRFKKKMVLLYLLAII